MVPITAVITPPVSTWSVRASRSFSPFYKWNKKKCCNKSKMPPTNLNQLPPWYWGAHRFGKTYRIKANSFYRSRSTKSIPALTPFFSSLQITRMPMPPAISQMQHSAKIVKEFMKRVMEIPPFPFNSKKFQKASRKRGDFVNTVLDTGTFAWRSAEKFRWT